MNYTTHQSFELANGTYLQGSITAGYEQLVQLFGEPRTGDGYKTDAEWIVEFEDGSVATVYNWKDGRNYLGREGQQVEQITEWHVGGKSKLALLLMESCIAQSNCYA